MYLLDELQAYLGGTYCTSGGDLFTIRNVDECSEEIVEYGSVLDYTASATCSFKRYRTEFNGSYDELKEYRTTRSLQRMLPLEITPRLVTVFGSHYATCVYVSRRTTRQWRRWPSEGNLDLRFLTEEYMPSELVLAKYHLNQMFSVQEAIELLQDRTGGVHIHNQFWLDDDHLLYYIDQPVGYFKEKLVLHPNAEFLLTELQEIKDVDVEIDREQA